MRVLVLCPFEPEIEFSDVLTRCLAVRGVPDAFNGCPERVPQTFEVGIAILCDDRFDGFGVLQRQPEGNGCAVVEDVDCVGCDFRCEQEGSDDFCQVLECVGEVGRDGCLAVAGEVRGDYVVGAREEGDQVAVLVRGGGKAVEEEYCW